MCAARTLVWAAHPEGTLPGLWAPRGAPGKLIEKLIIFDSLSAHAKVDFIVLENTLHVVDTFIYLFC
jgi:hypothetical protein